MESISRLELQDKQSKLFVYAQEQGVNVLEYIICFMKSSLVKELDKEFSNVQLEPINSWFEEIMNKNKISKLSNNKINNEILLWLGYFYRQWHFLTGEPSFKIIRYLPPNEAVKSYMLLHQIEENDAIVEMKNRYNKKRSAHRKYESKLYKLDSSFYKNDDKYFAFLAKKILYRLTNDERINKMTYINDHLFTYNNLINLDINVIRRDSNIKIYNTFDKYNSSIKNKGKNIMFYFIFSKEYELQSPDNIELKKEINKIRDINQYGEVYIYILGKLYFINLSKDIITYNIPISNRTRASVKLEADLNDAYLEISEELKL